VPFKIINLHKHMVWKKNQHHPRILNDSLDVISWTGIFCCPLNASLLSRDFLWTIILCSICRSKQNYQSDSSRRSTDTGFIKTEIKRRFSCVMNIGSLAEKLSHDMFISRGYSGYTVSVICFCNCTESHLAHVVSLTRV